MPIAFACSAFSGNSVTMIARITAEATAPPIPWTKRPAISIPWLVEAAAEDRGGGEQDEPGEEDFLAPDEIAHPPGEQQEAAEGDQVGVDHPREVALGEVQVALNRGQRDVHDRRVEHHHQLAEAQHPERDPAAALAARCLGGGGVAGFELICGGAHDVWLPFSSWRGHTIAWIILVIGMIYIKFIIVAKMTTNAEWCKITRDGC